MASYQQRRQMTHNLLQPLNYGHRQSAETQINGLLHQINSLKPSVDVYTYNNGASAQLFKLDGTIPIIYKGTQYNIPVIFWFPLEFPQTPPICYVNPVQGMKVKQRHRHVDAQGLIYHPYLHGWKANVNHSLGELIGLLCSEFGKDPPLYAQRASQVKPQYQPQPQPMQQQQNAYNPYQMQQQPQQPQQPMQPMQPPSYMNQNNNVNNSLIKNNNISQNNSSNMDKNLNNNNNNINNNDDDSESSLRNKVETKLRQQLQIVYDTENAELNELAKKQKRLDEHRDKIEKVKSDLENESALLVARKSDLEKQIGNLEEWLKKNEDSNELKVSSIVMPCDTYSEQCIDAVASDVAYTDVIIELDKELEDETVTLDQYMKQIRKAAREQFMKRALARAVYMKQNEIVARNNPQMAQQANQGNHQRQFLGARRDALH